MSLFLHLTGVALYGLLALAAYNLPSHTGELQAMLPYPAALAGLVFLAGLTGHLAVLNLRGRSPGTSSTARPGTMRTLERGMAGAERQVLDKLTRELDPPPPKPAGPKRKKSKIAPRDGSEQPDIVAQVRAAVSAGRIDIMLQPVVSLPQRKTCFFECLSRVRTEKGKVLEPAQYISAVTKAGLITAVDNVLLFRCVQLVRQTRRRNRNIGFFCNLSTSSLKDQKFFAEFVPFLFDNSHLSGSLTFEFKQDDLAQLDEAGRKHLAKLAALGFRYSVDHISRLDMNPEVLANHHIKFLKAPIKLLLENVNKTKKLQANLSRHGIDLIADRVEDEEDLIRFLDHATSYGQGFLLGPPRPARESKL